MHTSSLPKFLRAAALLLLGGVLTFGTVGCADTYATAPVYRGAYYAYDAYPYGYQGYPAHPYYGAPFGGGASALVIESSRLGYRRGYDGYRRNRTLRSDRRNRAVRRSVRTDTEATIQR